MVNEIANDFNMDWLPENKKKEEDKIGAAPLGQSSNNAGFDPSAHTGSEPQVLSADLSEPNSLKSIIPYWQDKVLSPMGQSIDTMFNQNIENAQRRYGFAKQPPLSERIGGPPLGANIVVPDTPLELEQRESARKNIPFSQQVASGASTPSGATSSLSNMAQTKSNAQGPQYIDSQSAKLGGEADAANRQAVIGPTGQGVVPGSTWAQNKYQNMADSQIDTALDAAKAKPNNTSQQVNTIAPTGVSMAGLNQDIKNAGLNTIMSSPSMQAAQARVASQPLSTERFNLDDVNPAIKEQTMILFNNPTIDQLARQRINNEKYFATQGGNPRIQLTPEREQQITDTIKNRMVREQEDAISRGYTDMDRYYADKKLAYDKRQAVNAGIMTPKEQKLREMGYMEVTGPDGKPQYLRTTDHPYSLGNRKLDVDQQHNLINLDIAKENTRLANQTHQDNLAMQAKRLGLDYDKMSQEGQQFFMQLMDRRKEHGARNAIEEGRLAIDQKKAGMKQYKIEHVEMPDPMGLGMVKVPVKVDQETGQISAIDTVALFPQLQPKKK